MNFLNYKIKRDRSIGIFELHNHIKTSQETTLHLPRRNRTETPSQLRTCQAELHYLIFESQAELHYLILYQENRSSRTLQHV